MILLMSINYKNSDNNLIEIISSNNEKEFRSESMQKTPQMGMAENNHQYSTAVSNPRSAGVVNSQARLTLSVEYDNFKPQESLSEKLTILRSIILEKAPPDASVLLFVKAVEMHFMIKVSMQIGAVNFQKEVHFDLENVNEITRYWLIRIGNDIMNGLISELENFKTAL